MENSFGPNPGDFCILPRMDPLSYYGFSHIPDISQYRSTPPLHSKFRDTRTHIRRNSAMFLPQSNVYHVHPYLQKQMDYRRYVLCGIDDCFIYFCKRPHKSNFGKLVAEIFPVYDLRCIILPLRQEFIACDYCSLGVESDFAQFGWILE